MDPDRQPTLYQSDFEHDACGVGLVANLRNRPTREVVETGLGVLRRLMHRGATGNDPETGDGAGILVQIPDAFFRKVVAGLPPAGEYAIAMVFGAEGEEAVFEEVLSARGMRVLAWRDVPVDPMAVGPVARAAMPRIRQLFAAKSAHEGTKTQRRPVDPEARTPLRGFVDSHDSDIFERELFVARRMVEKRLKGGYVCSFSARTIVYKGLLLATQIERFYPDLADPDFTSALALVHQRYSTNTFPSWELAHPFRMLAHNGEINTLKGNLNALRAREPSLASLLLGDDAKELFPLVRDGQSDSASLDNLFELLVAAGRDPAHAMLMLMPQAWGAKYHMGHDVRGFCEYHSALMEPWDGPAAVAFTDGVSAGAALDRNGLRPARWTLRDDGLFVLASEAGVADVPPERVVRHGRLKPGSILWLDLPAGRLAEDAEVKTRYARRRPYRRWVEENRIAVQGLFTEIVPSPVPGDLRRRQRAFGYTDEDLELVLSPMAKTGAEPVGSMGNDAPPAALSSRRRSLFDCFHQLFAQVTNPPIDPIREALVMSLTTYIGNVGNILEETPAHARLIKLRRPILTEDELARLSKVDDRGFPAARLPIFFGEEGLAAALDTLGRQAVEAVRGGARIVVLTDREPCAESAENAASSPDPARAGQGPGRCRIPSLLATAAANRALVDAGLRPSIGLVVESGEVREVHHFAVLLGYGATAIHPYLALETVSDLCPEDPVAAASNYVQAVDKGLLKIMSKMGISTLRSYRSAQIFEAVGLAPEVIDACFPGTPSRVGGLRFGDIERRIRESAGSEPSSLLDPGGLYRWRNGAEEHLWTPKTVAALRLAARTGEGAKLREYAEAIDAAEARGCTLRGLLRLREAAEPLPLDAVEPVESILRRFVGGAMSLGSLSPEAHETIARAFNSVGSMSNGGEGGVNAERYGTDADCGIKQVASGRFGVTVGYLRSAKDIQIKLAQGAKPGEGGQLPAHKVNPFVAKLRHARPGTTLISPPPHHDIYSIEDLAQLVYDLRCANPAARISVKLVSEAGVGTVAAGVAKAHADVVLVSGWDGGTGAAPLTSVKHAGLPWELGLAEAQQTLVRNGLRGRVKLQVDGQLRTGRDIVVAAILGAEEFGFGTALLVSLGCVQDRRCHCDTCPAGIATQNECLRAKFAGRPEHVVNFLRFLAEDTRRRLAAAGLRSLDEAIGRTDLLEPAGTRSDAALWDMSRILAREDHHAEFAEAAEAAELDHGARSASAPVATTGPHIRFTPGDNPYVFENYDRRELLPEYLPVLDSLRAQAPNASCAADPENRATQKQTPRTPRTPRDAETPRTPREIQNVDRTVGAELSGEIAARFGEDGLPDGTVRVDFRGVAGQSFGAFLARGVEFRLEGAANDFLGKGLSGGVIAVAPPPGSPGFKPEENVVAGNVVAYGGTSGRIFLCGQAGERFAIRNSGVTLVAEGIGDHGCEYMTGGTVVVLGPTGVNFGAGMTGGAAYVLDEAGDFDLRCNLDSIDLRTLEPGSDDEAELRALVEEHRARTGSPLAGRILADWTAWRPRFVKVVPVREA